ncbi:hypothetical protein V6V47_11205 [Micromonospora sp. CPCC 205539]
MPATQEPIIINDYRFSAGFSSVQGDSQWSYQQWNGSTYSNMTWDASRDGWRGNCTFCIITRDWVHPDSNDSVIVWQAPRSGRIAVRGVMDHGLDTRDSDGVRTFIRMSSAGGLSKIWPSADAQVIRPGFTTQHVLTTNVAAGDRLYFHVNQGANSGYDTLSWDPRISYDFEPKFTLDQAEVVMAPADYQRVGITLAQDASLSVVPNGTNLDFYHSSGDVIQKFRGTLQQPAQTPVYNGNRYTNPRGLAGKWWIANTYETPEGHILAFCHIESADVAATGWWVLGLAYSTDGGNTFQKLGYTIGHEVKDTGHNINIGGVPYVVRDGYFYAYFEEGAEHVARAPVAEVLAAAKRGEVSPWWKYHNGAWNEPGMHGRATPVLPFSPNHFYMTHGDAAYSTYLGKYLLSSYNHGAGKGVYLATSDDAVSYDVPSWIQTGRWEREETLSPYQTIVNVDGTDNGVVGQSFYVYYSYRARTIGLPEAELPANWRWLYRQKVTLNSAGFDGNTFDASTGFTNKQGENGWRYAEYTSSGGYTDLRWDADRYRWNGSATFLMATSYTQHPADGGRDSVRTWTAPRDGTVRVDAAMGGIRLGPGGNGVGVRIARGGTPLWPTAGYQALAPDTVHAFQPVDITVAKGDVLAFHVNSNGDTAFDTVIWAPTITYQAG